MKKTRYYVFILLLAAGYILGKYRTAENTYHYFGDIIRKLLLSSEDYIYKGKKINSINIEVASQEYEKLKLKRECAIDTGCLLSSPADYVQARLTSNNFNEKIEIRLKGDMLDHLTSDKLSYRIKIKSDSSFMGMKKFSIQSPHTRLFLNEWFVLKCLKKENVLTIKYDFINVSINNKPEKIYAIEEAFGSHFFKENNLEESVIFKFNEDLMYEEKVYSKHFFEFQERAFHVSNIDAFGLNKVLKNESLKTIFLKGKTLLEKFRNGELKTSTVFDLEKMAKYYALCSVLGSEHGLVWHNLRFYFNPETEKLEPIAYDLNPGKIQKDLISNNPVLGFGWHNYDSEKSFYHLLFSDTNFFKRYNQFVFEYANSDIVEKVYQLYFNEIKFYSYILRKEYLDYNFSKNIFIENQEVVSKLFKPIKSINAYLDSLSDNDITLTIGNIHSFPIEILSIDYNQMRFIPEFPILLQSKRRDENVIYFKKIFIKQPNKINEKISNRIYYRILGLNEVLSDEIFLYKLSL